MSGLPYYKAYPRDFLEGTLGMDLEVKGAYRVLLDLIYMHGGELLDDARFISGHLGCSVRKWSGIRQTLISIGKIVVRNGHLANYRADKEMIILQLHLDKQRENASKPRKNNGLTEAMAEPKPSHTEPDTDKKREIGKPISRATEGFDEFWASVPRKKSRGAALKAYATALRKTDAQTILSGMRRYAETRRGQDPQYTAHPATWLNAEGWSDEPETQSTTKGTPNGKGELRLAAALRGAAVSSPLDSGQGGNPSQPLLAIR